jgi:succinate dehydrogenase flavoprotein subunit
MTETLSCDIAIIGSGLAGMRAAIAGAMASKEKLRIGVFSKVQAMRSHSVSAEGGTAAVLYPQEGDSIESHVYDTVKGSDFLADQNAAERFCTMVPQEIFLLEHWGMPWSRRPDGRIAQRAFGAMSYDRACFAGDRVGFYEMQTLYDTCLRHESIHFYDEWQVTSILVESGEFRGLTAIDLKSGNFYAIKAKAGIIATGGAGRMFSFATYAHSSTPEGLAMAYRVGIPIKDMEFVQFHPTGMIPSGILITEASRGEGGFLINKNGERFMAKYAPNKLDLASRDVVSRGMITEINEGRGYSGPDGLDYLHLDLRPLGEEKIKERLGGIREITMKFLQLDPISEPIPVRPVCHYMMGGVDTNIEGATRLPGLWSAGEAACVSMNGANRLGSNSTGECLVWGRITGEAAAGYSAQHDLKETPAGQVQAEEKRIFDKILRGHGSENPYEIRHKIQRIMDQDLYIYRTEEGMKRALSALRELRKRAHYGIQDQNKEYNTNLTNTLEFEGLFDIAEVTILGALERQESRGSHARLDYPKRDDAKFMQHTLAFYTSEGPRIEYAPVTVTKYKPEERKY